MSQNKGFTLIEIIVVIAIIGILATVVLFSASAARIKGKVGAIKTQMSEMYSQSQIFYAGNLHYGTANSNTSPSTYRLDCVSGGSFNVTSTEFSSLFSSRASNASAPGLYDILQKVYESGATQSVVCRTARDEVSYENFATSWLVAAVLPGGGVYCVDSTGRASDKNLAGTLYTDISSAVGSTTRNQTLSQTPAKCL